MNETCSYPVDFSYAAGDCYCCVAAHFIWQGHWYCGQHYDMVLPNSEEQR
jgi:hypothetical protein